LNLKNRKQANKRKEMKQKKNRRRTYLGEAQLAQPNTSPANLPFQVVFFPELASSLVEYWGSLDPPPPPRRTR
jgi:hypothetical protein